MTSLFQAGPGQGARCLRWRGAINDGEKRSQAEGSNLRWRGVFAGGGGAVSMKGSKGSGLRWREVVASGGNWSQVEGSDRWWRGAVSGEGERSLDTP